MMRLMATGAVCGALIAGGAWYAANGAAQTGVTAVVSIASEAFPICTTMPELGAESDWARLDPDFAAGRKALAEGNWAGAVRAFDLAALRQPLNADIQNYIGYAHARLARLGPAMGHYQRALMLDPRHRGARRHLGELYLALGSAPKAREQLAALKDVCLIPCDEIAYLERAIDVVAQRVSLAR